MMRVMPANARPMSCAVLHSFINAFKGMQINEKIQLFLAENF